MSEHDYPPVKPGEEWDASNRDELVDTILWYQIVNRGWQKRAKDAEAFIERNKIQLNTFVDRARRAEAERDDALERLALVREKVVELEDAIECWRVERDELRIALDATGVNGREAMQKALEASDE